MDDLIHEFVEETVESLAALDNELIRLESNPDDAALIGSIFRLMHTIKGTCGFLGLSRLEAVAHAGENIMGKIRDKAIPATQQAITLILQAIDVVKHLVEHLAAEGAEPEGNDKELIDRLNAFANQTGGHEAPAETAGFAESMQNVAEAPLEVLPVEEVALDAEVQALPEEKQEGGTEVSLDELECIFQETQVDESSFITTPLEDVTVPVAEPVSAAEATPVVAAKPEVSQAAKQRAVEEGLKSDAGEKGVAVGSIRVSLDVLEHLMQTVSELVLTRNQLTQIARTRNDTEFMGPIQRLGHITTELQEGVMKTRMQPIGNAWSKFPRLVRDLSLELGKKIALHMSGEETELDRQLLEMIKDPLTHMVRNSVDHGLEKPEDRRAAGKREEGAVYIRAYHEGGHIIVEIQDDGRGLNLDRIKQKALANGLATEQELAEMSDQRIMQFIFHAGFSTAEQVTNVSGRGVGMDVVRSNIEKIGGAIELQSEMGKGSTFRIKIPLTLAIVSVLIVGAGKFRFAIPQINVTEMVYASPKAEYKIERIDHAPVMRLRKKLLPLIHLGRVLGLHDAEPLVDSAYVVICNVGGYDFGVIVDRVFDTEEIVVKPVSPILQQIDVYSGSTILGDGSVILILDPNGLARTTGEVQVDSHQVEDESLKRQQAFNQRMIRFLLFTSGDNTPKAVPLDLVSRLEDVDAALIEHSGTSSVVQYRDELMVLISLHDGYDPPSQEGLHQVVVFTYEGKYVGLVVREIIDIVDSKLDVKISSDDPKLIGSMVINGKTTDVIDTAHILSEAIGELAESRNDQNEKSGNNGTILIVDDSNFFRNLNAPYLSARGYDVLTAEGPTEALQIMGQEKRIDLIISDIEMPDISGVEFAEICRDNPLYKGIPMIAFTSQMTSESVQRGMQAGFKAYVSKTDRDGLLREVVNLLN